MSLDHAATLSAVPELSGLDPALLAELGGAFDAQQFPDGARVLRQGTTSAALYLLKRGTVAVRVQRAGHRETVAELLPPSFFGELSFLTGRTCSADVEAVGPIEVAVLTRDRLDTLGVARDALLQVLLHVVARRLHDVVTGTPTLHRPRTVWLRPDDGFRATGAMAHELAAALAADAAGPTLLVADGPDAGAEPGPRAGAPYSIAAPPADLADRIGRWREEFRYTVVVDRPGGRPPDDWRRLADATGDLLGGGRPMPAADTAIHVAAADADRVRLEVLTGARQALFDVEAAARSHAGRGEMPRWFRRTAGSLARAIAGRQVGLALGGGGACCWAHIGLLSVLEEAGLPIDVVAGCSMGSFIGGLIGTGRSVADMTRIAEHWRTAYVWMVEPRFWRMHLTNERRLRKVMAHQFGEVELPQLRVPFWANAVDVLTGEEVVIDRGRVRDAVRASMSLPGSSPPVERGPHVLVDAAVLAPVPAGPVRKMGAHFVIGMNVMPAMKAGTIPRHNPMRFFDVLFRALRISGHEIGRNRSATDADILLTPRLDDYSLLDFPRAPEIIRAGEEAAGGHRAQIAAAYQSLVDARR